LPVNLQKNHIRQRRIQIRPQANSKCLSSTRILSVTLAILLGCSCAWAQEKEIKSCISVHISFEDCGNPLTHNYKEIEKPSAKATEPAPVFITPVTEHQQKESRFAQVEAKYEQRVKENDSDGTNIKNVIISS